MRLLHEDTSHAHAKEVDSPRMVEVNHQHNRVLFSLDSHWGRAGFGGGDGGR